ncbi:hypothetical protein WNB94_04355 [Aquabacterium sp. A3]
MQAKVVMNRCFDLLSSVFGNFEGCNAAMKSPFSAQFSTDQNEKADPEVG